MPATRSIKPRQRVQRLASVATAALCLLSPANAGVVRVADQELPVGACDFTISNRHYDLGKLNNTQNIRVDVATPPTMTSTNYQISLCSPIAHDPSLPDLSQCPAGTLVCMIVTNLLGTEPTDPSDPEKDKKRSPRVIGVVPIAGDLGQGKYEREVDLKDGKGKADKDVVMKLKGGSYNGKEQKAEVRLLCDKEAKEDSTPVFERYDAEDGKLRVNWTTPFACETSNDGGGGGSPAPTEPSSGRGFFSTLLWYGFLAFVAYMIIGAYYNRTQYGAQGWDLVPNRDFWQSVPNTATCECHRNYYTTMSDPGSHGPDHEHLAGTEYIIESADHEATLIPHPTNSPNDPLNWSQWRKYWHAFLVLFVVGLTAATSNDAGSASDAFLDMGISYDIDNIGAGVLFAGIGYTTFLLSPLPALYGRRSTYLICLLSSIAGSTWFANTKRPTDAIWSQLFVGASESCAEAAAQLSLSELFYSHQRGTVLGLYILATSVGTFLGPLFAGLIADNDKIGWAWIGWFATIISVVTLIVFLFGFEETTFNRKAILNGVQPTNPSLAAHELKEKGSKTSGELQDMEATMVVPDQPKTYWQRIAIVTPSPLLEGMGFKQYFMMLFQTLRVFGFPAVLYAGLQWGAQDAWLTFYLTVEEDNYYDDPWDYGDTAVALMNIPTLIGAVIGCFYGGWFSDRFMVWMAKRRGGISEAEDRLWLMYPAGIISPAGLILFGVGSGKGWLFPQLWAVYVALGFIGFGWGCAGDIGLSYLADCYPDMILEGMVGVAVINNSIALIFTFCTGIWMDTQTLAQVFIAIGVLSFVFFMTTMPMHYWGKAARRKTAARYNKFLEIRDGK